MRNSWKKVKCPVCGKMVCVTPNGYLRAHTMQDGGRFSLRLRCPGSYIIIGGSDEESL